MKEKTADEMFEKLGYMKAEINTLTVGINYKIIFENIYTIEKE